MSYPNQYINALSPRQKAMRWRQKKWIKVRHVEDMCCDNARLIPKYAGKER